jgi:hypothetical protein
MKQPGSSYGAAEAAARRPAELLRLVLDPSGRLAACATSDGGAALLRLPTALMGRGPVRGGVR